MTENLPELSVTTRDGVVREGFIRFDPSLLNAKKLTDAGFYTDAPQSVREEADEIARREYMDKFREIRNNMFDLSNRELTLAFCKTSGSGAIPQFRARRDFFNQRLDLIKDSKVYKFKDDFIKLMIEKNNNDAGYRHMPFNNIFLECFLEFGEITVNGIHIVKVLYDEDGNTQVYLDRDDRPIPPTHNKEGISVFFTGYDGKGANYYNYFSLSKDDTVEYEVKKKGNKYACPLCNGPMTPLTKTELCCENKICLENFQKGAKLIFDLKDKDTVRMLSVMDIKEVWKIEDEIRLFVSNFLDFITNPEVEVRPFLTGKERQKRNEKRVKRGKSELPHIELVTVCGHLYKYTNTINKAFKGDYYRAKQETWVKGHFFRFWNADRWTNIYGLLKGCRSDTERENKLKKYQRKDGDGHLLPESQQYQWDSTYQVVKVWKLPFLQNKGEGTDDKEKIRMVKL